MARTLYYYTRGGVMEEAVLLRKYKRVKIKCIETGEIFESASHAAASVGCGKSAMSNHLAGRYEHIRNLHFERVT